MLDKSRSGMLCRAKVTIRAHEATIEVDSYGRIVYEIENLGRRLVLVEWEGDSSLFVFPNEIEIENVE